MICLEGNVVIITLGNELRGDDGAGILFGNLIKGKTPYDLDVFDGLTAPENITRPVVDSKPDNIIIVDAMDFGGHPGEVGIALSDELSPDTISTHGTLGLFTEYLKIQTGANIYILGFQSQSLTFGTEISPEISESVHSVAEIFIKSKNISQAFKRLTE